MLNGRAYGMVCCEETKTRRDWRVADVVRAARHRHAAGADHVGRARSRCSGPRPRCRRRPCGGSGADANRPTARGSGRAEPLLTATRRREHAPPPCKPPERLGKYLIRRELGRGAMGVVYGRLRPADRARGGDQGAAHQTKPTRSSTPSCACAFAARRRRPGASAIRTSSRSTSTARKPARAAPSSPWSWSKAAT